MGPKSPFIVPHSAQGTYRHDFVALSICSHLWPRRQPPCRTTWNQLMTGVYSLEALLTSAEFLHLASKHNWRWQDSRVDPPLAGLQRQAEPGRWRFLHADKIEPIASVTLTNPKATWKLWIYIHIYIYISRRPNWWLIRRNGEGGRNTDLIINRINHRIKNRTSGRCNNRIDYRMENRIIESTS